MNRTNAVIAAIAAVLAIVLVACGGSDNKLLSTTPPGQPFPDDMWQLTYAVSGGIDGRSYNMTLATDGSLKLEDVRAKRMATRTIDAAEISRGAGFLASSGMTGPQPTRNDGCADCIDIKLTVVSGGRTYTTSVNEVNQQPRLGSLLTELRSVYDKNAP